MNTYIAYGLGIHSEFKLPELVPVPAMPDVNIHVGIVNCPISEESETPLVQATEKDAIVFQYRIGSAQVRDGKEIVIDPRAGVDEHELRLFLLGPVFATLLHQRGHLVLHASAVNLNNRAVAFLAEPGGGKSTSAATFLARGYPLVTDDILAVSVDGAAPPMTYPAFPFIKISPNVADALGDDVRTAPRVSAQSDKRIHSTRDFSGSALTLSRMYVLSEGETFKIERMTAQEAFVALVHHTFVIHILDSLEKVAHFQQCSALANAVPMAHLKRPRSLNVLDQIVDLVERDDAN